MGSTRALLFLIAVLWLVLAGHAEARTAPTPDRICTGGAASMEEAFALEPASLDCEEGRFARRDTFVRSHALIDSRRFPIGEPLLWQTDPSFFDSMAVRFAFADGSRRIVRADRQSATRNWIAGNRFYVPVPTSDAPLVEVDTVVERPRTAATLRNAEVVAERTSARQHYVRSLIYMMVCGLLLVPIIYNLLFFRVLQSRFMISHLVMTTATLVYVLSSSGLAFVFWPDLALQTRWHLNTVSLSLAIAAAVIFAIGLVEDRVVPRWLYLALIGTTIAMLAIKLVALFDIEALRLAIVPWYQASLVAIAVAIIAMLATGLRRGSRATVYLAIGFSGMVLCLSLVLMSQAGLISASFPIEDLIYAALVILVIGTSAGAGDRFQTLRSERDRARKRAAKLGRMANTDGLTGLLNRRAFDRIEYLESGRGFLLADIDRFKPINDEFGHQTGDEVLRHAARLLRAGIESGSRARIFRLGGEEFAILLDADDRQTIIGHAERLRELIETESGGERDIDLPPITVSIGGVLGEGQPMRDALRSADRALYRAKQGGRNRSIVHALEDDERPADDEVAVERV